jgi:hypothetical protein
MADHVTLAALDETGFVVLDRDERRCDPAEWLGLEYTGWRSSGITRFAPLTSFAGEVECNAFWNHTPPRADKGGVWIPAQVRTAPTLARRAQEPGADVGRCRVVELQPNTYADAVGNLHRDDNNRLNPAGTGWVVRGFLNLTDDAESMMLLRPDRMDAAGEVRIPLPAGTRVIVDTQRLWHAVWQRGSGPRYGLVASWESGPELADYVARLHGTSTVPSPPIDAALVADAQAELVRRIEERQRMEAALGGSPLPADG